MNTYDSIITRRSTRKYLNKPVERELLERVIETGRYAPSGGNSQSNHFIVIQDRKIIEKLVELTQKAFSQMKILMSAFVIRLCSPKKVGMYFAIMHRF